MRIDEYRATLLAAEPPTDLSVALQALWWDGKGDWERAHECVQENETDPTCAWVHGYLHRKEGDLFNAAYWYRQAKQPVATGSLDAEWRSMVSSLLKQP